MKSKCEAIFKNIIMESIENSPVKYKAYGFWQLAPDDYENGNGEIVKSGVFDDYFGKTAVEAIKRLVTNEGIELTGGFEVVDINGKTELQGTDEVILEGDDFKTVDISENKELFEQWKKGEAEVYSYIYQIVIQKVTYANINEKEIESINQAFA